MPNTESASGGWMGMRTTRRLSTITRRNCDGNSEITTASAASSWRGAQGTAERSGIDGERAGSCAASARKPNRGNPQRAAGHYGRHISAIGALLWNIRSAVDDPHGRVCSCYCWGCGRCTHQEGSASSRRGLMVRSWDEETGVARSEEHTSELQSRQYLVCRLL